MGGWRKYLEAQAQAKTGLSSGLFVWAFLAVVFGIVTAGFVLLIAFISLAERYDPLTAAIALAGFFLLVTIIAVICCLWSRRRTIERAELALAARGNATWLDPKVVGSATQVSRAVGWRKLVPLLAVGMLAAGVGMEWLGRDRPEVESEEQNGRRKLARAA
jgi:type VI protein secretion system component VasK